MEYLIEKWAKKIVRWSLGKQEVLSSEQEEILTYGYVLLIENAYKLVILLIVALLTHTLLETVIIIGSFILLRNFGGGIHCKGSIGCALSMVGVWLVGLLLARICIPFPILIIMSGIIIWTIIRYAPQTTKNNPIQNAQIRKKKHIGAILVMTFLFGVAFVLGFVCERMDVMNMILTSMFIEAVSILILVEKEEKANEKNGFKKGNSKTW